MTIISTMQEPDNTWHVQAVVLAPEFIYEGSGLTLGEAYRQTVLRMGEAMQGLISEEAVKASIGHYEELVAGTSYDD